MTGEQYQFSVSVTVFGGGNSYTGPESNLTDPITVTAPIATTAPTPTTDPATSTSGSGKYCTYIILIRSLIAL